MLHSVVSNVTSVALLAHVLLGCCRHHGHVCPQQLVEQSAEQLARAAALDVAAAACGTEASEDDLLCSAEPFCEHRHADDSCQGGRCVFVPVPPGSAAAIWLVQYADAAPLGTAVVAASAAWSPCGELSVAAACCPPLRIHLLHQVLLI